MYIYISSLTYLGNLQVIKESCGYSVSVVLYMTKHSAQRQETWN